MRPQCTHITRKRGVYYYRRRVPGVGNGEVSLSMRTRVYPEAEWLAHRLDQRFLGIIKSVSQSANGPDVALIAQEYLRRALDGDLAQRAASGHKPVYALNYEDDEPSSKADLAWVEAELRTAKTELRERLYEHQRPLVDFLMESNGLPQGSRDAFMV